MPSSDNAQRSASNVINWKLITISLNAAESALTEMVQEASAWQLCPTL